MNHQTMLSFQLEQDFQSECPPPESIFYLHNSIPEMEEVNLDKEHE